MRTSEPARLLALSASLVLGAAVAGLLAATFTAHAAEPASGGGFRAGIEVRTEANAADIGLPVYPGATAQPGDGKDSGAATVGLWGGSLGFHLAVLKYTSPAPLDNVAAYYRDAMGRYGQVLDCSQARPTSGNDSDSDSEQKPKTLRCGKDDKADPGGRLYKVGTPGNQRIVSIKPAAGGVVFQLLRIETQGG